MRRVVLLFVAAMAAMAIAVPVALAGSPHFVGSPTGTLTGNALTVQGKEAGLGNEAQIQVQVSGLGLCINGGGHHPKAVNKESFSAVGVFPVQNGKADFSLTLTATFSPNC